MDGRPAERSPARDIAEHHVPDVPAASEAAPTGADAGRRRWLDALVGQGEEEPDDERIGEDGRPSVADVRQSDAGQWQNLEIAGGDDECLDPDHERQTDREQRAKVVGSRGTDPEPALDDHEEQSEDRDHADDAELLAERREREVGVDLGDRRPTRDRWQTVAEPDAEQSAAGEGVKRLDDLIPGTERVGERIEPDLDRARMLENTWAMRCFRRRTGRDRRGRG